MTAPLSWAGALSTWRLDVVSTVVLVVLGLGYLAFARRAQGWQAKHVVAFESGIVLGLITVDSAIDAYSGTLYWMHMTQHLLLIMVVPALLILGKPLTLLAQVGGDRVAGFLRGRFVGALTTPGVTLLGYAIVVVGTHLTPFLALERDYPILRWVEILAYVIGGYLFLLTMFGGEPIRWQLSYPLRLFLALTGMAVDTIVGVVLMMSSSTDPLSVSGMTPRSWGLSPLADLRAGGAIMWVFGDGLMVLIAVYVIGAWMRSPRDTGMGQWLEAARRQQFAEATGVSADLPETGGDPGEDPATVEDDEEANLAAYNAMLRRLAEREHRSER